ncbi:hypothetical protein SS1G_03350 [Sclerotinia sclerotiorum 1980 UF-70]|uniref:J domain-containing protein n=1 Tax=Sclerotinia sclerotiorum (strain ATCC 18683 / 1980 / Ss-1) TaxID=665079 RepID=A7EDG0_SCLS1|nr:hypothetical protein SS1G_03350 [Sclerotinia sclerotiorum 1980 UF-70]EDO00876.1 hypothetical protein SS1G_03350 [Sclerotinia sclerotiorum 1980 UF-70]
MTTNGASDEMNLYGILGISKDATKSEIKKAYHKAALQHHPDKVAEDQREEADEKFKTVSQAYEILYDEEKREIRPGMGAGGVDLDDILSQMFGMGGGMGGMGGMPPGFGGPGGPGGPRKPRRGADEEQPYKISLEDLYKGKTVKFTSKKNVICSHCKGTGGKEKAKPETCSRCKGNGVTMGLRSVGPGTCHPRKELCAIPVQELVKSLRRRTSARNAKENAQPRNRNHWSYGRGISINHPQGKVLQPGQILKVEGEGMPLKKSDAKGDLYLIVKIEFPQDGWTEDTAAFSTLQQVLPKPGPPITTEEVDEVEYDSDADIDDFGANSGDPRAGGEWEDDEEDDEGGAQCATQ